MNQTFKNWLGGITAAANRLGLLKSQVSRDLMRLSAELARHHGARLHTHLAENDHDLAYSREKFNCTPTQYAQDLGWLGPDVWHAHCVKLDDEGIGLFAATKTGVAHCPCSNMRLASGIAPVRNMLNAGVGLPRHDTDYLLPELSREFLGRCYRNALNAHFRLPPRLRSD
mgnify:CR=1 FL=1